MHNYKRSQAGVVAPPVAYESVIPNPKAKLLDQIREVMRLKHYSIRTERTYADWVRRYVQFHGMKSCEEMFPAEPKIEAGPGSDRGLPPSPGTLPGSEP